MQLRFGDVLDALDNVGTLTLSLRYWQYTQLRKTSVISGLGYRTYLVCVKYRHEPDLPPL